MTGRLFVSYLSYNNDLSVMCYRSVVYQLYVAGRGLSFVRHVSGLLAPCGNSLSYD